MQFGGAVTEAAGHVYSLMDEEQKKQLLETYFSKENMNYRLVRIHLDSCDFCLDMYEAMSDPEDKGLASFSFDRTDHNKERIYERVRDVVDESTKDMVAGAAFHWYSGDHFESMDLVRKLSRT